MNSFADLRNLKYVACFRIKKWSIVPAQNLPIKSPVDSDRKFPKRKTCLFGRVGER